MLSFFARWSEYIVFDYLSSFFFDHTIFSLFPLSLTDPTKNKIKCNEIYILKKWCCNSFSGVALW